MASSDRSLNALYQVIRILDEQKLSPATKVERLYEYLFENEGFHTHKFELPDLSEWDQQAMDRALDYAEEIIVRFARHYYDPRVIPVTYYKRERRSRRHLDKQLSRIFKEVIRRSGQAPVIELVTEEPIYYLKQLAREKRFPRSKDGRASFGVLKTRFHLALSHRLTPL